MAFDLNVQTRNKEGAIVGESPYTLKCDRANGNIFIRDGVKFYPDGTPLPNQDLSKVKKREVEEKPIERNTPAGFVPKDKK